MFMKGILYDGGCCILNVCVRLCELSIYTISLVKDDNVK